MKKLIILLLLLGRFSITYSQELKKDLTSMSSVFGEANKIKVLFDVNIIQRKGDGSKLNKQSYEVNKNGNEFFYILNESNFLFNERCALMINNNQKYIFYNEHGEIPNFEKRNFDLDIDSLIENCDSISFAEDVSGKLHYTLYQYTNSIFKIDVIIDKESRLMDKIIYTYNEEQSKEISRVEIEYRKWELNPVFEEDEFSEFRFINKSKNQVVSNNAYKDYQIIVSN